MFLSHLILSCHTCPCSFLTYYSPVTLVRAPVSPTTLLSRFRSRWGSQDKHTTRADQSFPDGHTVSLSVPLSHLIFSCHACLCSCLTLYSPVMLIRVPVSPNALLLHIRSCWGSQDEHPGRADQSFPEGHAVCLSVPLSHLIFSCHAYPCSCLT